MSLQIAVEPSTRCSPSDLLAGPFGLANTAGVLGLLDAV